MNWTSWDNRVKHMQTEFLKAVAYSNSFASLHGASQTSRLHPWLDKPHANHEPIKAFDIQREPQTKSVRIGQIKILQPTYLLLEKRRSMEWPKKCHIFINSLDSVVLIMRRALPWPPNKVFTNHPPIGVWEFDSHSRLLTNFRRLLVEHHCTGCWVDVFTRCCQRWKSFGGGAR